MYEWALLLEVKVSKLIDFDSNKGSISNVDYNNNATDDCVIECSNKNIEEGYKSHRRRRRARGSRSAVVSGSDSDHHRSGTGDALYDEKSANLIVSNISDGADEQRLDIVHDVLTAIVPSVSRDDVVSITSIRPDSLTKHSSVGSTAQYQRRILWLVCLSGSDLVDNHECEWQIYCI